MALPRVRSLKRNRVRMVTRVVEHRARVSWCHPVNIDDFVANGSAACYNIQPGVVSRGSEIVRNMR